MATAIAEQPVLGAYVKEGATQFSTLTMTAGDAANMNSIVMGTGRCLVIFQNADVSNAEWVTVDASDDPYGRALDINQQSLAAASWASFVFEPRGWEQTLGGKNLLIDVESADVKILAIPL
jgi:hypothetical protein